MDSQCPRHPEEKLRFVCVPCNTPVCRDCKLTQHEGHRTLDIDIMASDVRHNLISEKEQVEGCLNLAKLLRDNVHSSIANLERTVEEAKSAMNKKLDAVIEWANTYRLVTDKRMRELKQAGKGEMETVLEYLEENIEYFDQMNTAMSQVVEETTSDQRMVKFHADFQKEHKSKYPTESELTVAVSGHARIMTSTSVSPDLCQRAIEQYMGLPRLTHVVKSVPPKTHWCFTSRVPASGNDQRLVTSLLPMRDGSISVLYRDSLHSGSGTTHLAQYSPDGLKWMDQPMKADEVVMVEPVANHLALFSVTSETFQPSPQGPMPGHDSAVKKPSRLVYLKNRQNSTSVVCEAEHPGWGRASAPFTVLELDVEDALKVAVNATGQYFAVLRRCNEVKVYQRHGKSALCTFGATLDLEKAALMDVCFYHVEGKEVLLVAEWFYNIILVTDHLQDCELTSFIPSPRPRPSAVCADVTGTLWIGCEGGEVVAGLGTSHSDADDFEIEEDSDGYLVPTQELYANILALNQQLLEMETPPERPPRPEYPSLPPKSDATKSTGIGQSGMPLKPPSRRPSTLWKHAPSLAAGKQIQALLVDRQAEEEGSSTLSKTETAESQPTKAEVKRSRPPAPPPATESGVMESDLPKDGEPSSHKPAPSSPQTLTRITSREHDEREDWMPSFLNKSPKVPPKSTNPKP